MCPPPHCSPQRTGWLGLSGGPSTLGVKLEVQVILSQHRTSGSETVRGGGQLTEPLSTTPQCTAGWPVRGTGGTTVGLITAEHCDGDFGYAGRNVLTYQRRLAYADGDIQYNSSTEDVGHNFYYNDSTWRDIDGPVGNPSTDQLLCLYGRKSGNHCDHVASLNTCRNDYCNLVAMYDHGTQGGDSGGPWYYGSRPYGVHSGWHETWLGQDQAQWTPLNDTLGKLNVEVKTGVN